MRNRRQQYSISFERLEGRMPPSTFASTEPPPAEVTAGRTENEPIPPVYPPDIPNAPPLPSPDPPVEPSLPGVDGPADGKPIPPVYPPDIPKAPPLPIPDPPVEPSLPG